jgi:hypothetical protein
MDIVGITNITDINEITVILNISNQDILDTGYVLVHGTPCTARSLVSASVYYLLYIIHDN